MIVDVINDIDFPDNDHMVKCAKPMAERIKALKEKCQKLGVPVIYCNDNFGKVGDLFPFFVVKFAIETELTSRTPVEIRYRTNIRACHQR